MRRLTRGPRGAIALLAVGSLVCMNVAQVSAAQRAGSGAVIAQLPHDAPPVNVYGWGLAAVLSTASDGSHLWIVTQCGLDGGEGDAIVELSASTGAFIRIITDVPDPHAVVANGSGLWVIDLVGDEVFQLSEATGATLHVYSSPHFNAPISLAIDGAGLWVLSGNGGLTELRASNGTLLRQVAIPPVDVPTAMVLARGELWVTEDGIEGGYGQPNRLIDVGVAVFSASTGKHVRFVQGPQFGFRFPSSIASNGRDVWVADADGQLHNAVTDISATNGALVKVLRGGYGFDGDDQVSLDGAFVLVHNVYDNTVTVLRASDDAFVRRIGLPNGPAKNAGPHNSWMVTTGGRVWVYAGDYKAAGIRSIDVASGKIESVVRGSDYGFSYPGPIASDGSHLWVGSGTAITEMSATDGSLVQVLRRPAYAFTVVSIAADSSHVWVLNYPGSVTELSASTGALIQVISGPQYDLQGAYHIASDGTHVWISNPAGGSITELSASTGALVQVLSGPDYELVDPGPISSDGIHVWVVNVDSRGLLQPHVTEIDAATGAFVRSIAASGDAIASDGTDVWLTVEQEGAPNYSGPGVIELSASTGAVVAQLNSPVNVPIAVASDGTDVWIADCECDFDIDIYGGITELSAATGAPVSPGSRPSDAINGPTAIALAGGRAWVTNSYGDSVTSFQTN